MNPTKPRRLTAACLDAVPALSRVLAYRLLRFPTLTVAAGLITGLVIALRAFAKKPPHDPFVLKERGMRSARTEAFWNAFCRHEGVNSAHYEATYFRAPPDVADSLLANMLAGAKRASVGLLAF